MGGDVPNIETVSVDNEVAEREKSSLSEDIAYERKTVLTSTTIDNHTEDNSVIISNISTNNIAETTNLSDINAADKEEMKKITKKIIHSFDQIKHILENVCDYIADSKENKTKEDEIKEGVNGYKLQLEDQFILFQMLNLELISFREIYPDRGTGPLFELATVFCEFDSNALTCTLSKSNEYHFSDIMNNYESALVVFRDFIFKY